MYGGDYKIRNIPHLRTGLNNRYDAGEIADTDITDMENVEVDTRSIRSAAGYVTYDSSPANGPFYGGFHAKFSGGTNRLIRQKGTKLQYDDGTGVWTDCTGGTGLTATACSFEMLNDIVLWSNGTDTVKSSTDGISWTDRAGLPKSQKLFNNGLNRILFMCQPSAPSRVDWSDINDPLTVGASAFQFFGKNDGQNIEDAVLLPNGSMILFKTGRFYQISDITLDTVATDPIGEAPCVRYTAVATENSAMWAGPDGKIYELIGGQAVLISDQVAPLSITKPASMRGVYFNNKYHLAVPNGSDSNNSYEYVVNRSLLTGNPKNPYVITKNQRYFGCYIKEDREVSGVRRNRLYAGDSRTNTLFAYINDEHDESLTQGLAGADQTCYFVTKYYTEDAPFLLKRYVKYFADIISSSAQTITVSYRFDQFDQWLDLSFITSSESLEWLYDDGTSSGTFSEGYSFSTPAQAREFKDIEETGASPYGIQFKISWTSDVDVEVLGQAYKFLFNKNFR